MSLADFSIDHSDGPEMRQKMVLRKKNFLFSFATIFVHELAHTFVGFIRNDLGRQVRLSTPVMLSYLDYGRRSNGTLMGEAGRWLEAYIFGGSIELYYDLTDDDGQVS